MNSRSGVAGDCRVLLSEVIASNRRLPDTSLREYAAAAKEWDGPGPPRRKRRSGAHDYRAPAPILACRDELLLNPGFEHELLLWKQREWRLGSAEFIATQEQFHSGKSSLLLRAQTMDDDAMCYQHVVVAPNTEYEATCFVRTEDVKALERADFGAGLSIYGGLERSEGLIGAHDWTKVTLRFNSGDRTSVELGPRLGHHFSAATGSAWFDDVTIRASRQASRRSKDQEKKRGRIRRAIPRSKQAPESAVNRQDYAVTLAGLREFGGNSL